MGYGWKITYNDVDISDKVGRFSIVASLVGYCREMNLDIVDKDFYAGLDFSAIPETPQIEIFTKVADDFVSQGTFFLERPALSVAVQSETLNGVWGRSSTAALGEPFASKVSKMWTSRTTFFAVCEEMCDLAGLTWDEAYSDIDNFAIEPYSVQADAVYPIDVLRDLAGLAGAIVTTDSAGHVCIKRIDYSPAAADATVTDPDIRELSESPEWPTFGNRVRITPSGSLAGYAVSLAVPSPCLHGDGASRTKLFAQVKDADGLPVNGLAVAWSIDSATAALASPATNTQAIVIEREEQRAGNYYDVDVDFPPSSVDGIFAYSDLARANNLASGGYTLEGNTITLTEKLEYCDQLLVVAYRSEGAAVNYLTSGYMPEDVVVTADVEGASDSATVYIDNPCRCAPRISLKANPSTIHPGEASMLLVYVEESGPASAGRVVFVSENTVVKKGSLQWSVARLGTVAIANERATARNEITGTTQCEVPMYPASVTSVYQADAEGVATGPNLYGSYAEKVIDLTIALPTGTDLLVNYTARGAALNRFTASSVGTARIMAYINTTREQGAEASATISIRDVNETIEDQPADAGGDGTYGGVGGLDDEFDPSAGTLCVQSDGKTVQCAEGERCCSQGNAKGCFPEAECDSGVRMNPCFPDNVSSDPSETNLTARFSDALEWGCGCEEICQNEFSVFETIQSYDGASFRTIAEIVVDAGFEEGSPGYWEQYEALKANAIAECQAACEEQALAWDEAGTPDTIAPGGFISLYVLYGCLPLTWSVSGKGYSLAAAETPSRSNQLNCVGGVCGVDYDAVATITVTDTCGGSISAKIRNTGGQWVWKADSDDSCYNTVACAAQCASTYSGVYSCDVIAGNTKTTYTYHWYACYHPETEGCPGCTCADMGFPPCATETAGDCHAYKSSDYEWEC